jgi:hypothetical protein
VIADGLWQLIAQLDHRAKAAVLMRSLRVSRFGFQQRKSVFPEVAGYKRLGSFLETTQRSIVNLNMRKTIVLLSLILASGFSIHAQTKTPRENERLIGPVRTMRIERQTVANAGGQAKAAERTFYMSETFDEKGNLTEQSHYDPEEKKENKYRWSHNYDDKGRETETLFLDAEGRLTNTGVAVYDKKGRRVENRQLNPDSSINHIQAFLYDDRGNMIRETFRKPDGTPFHSVTRSYDERGNVVEAIFLNGEVVDHRSVMTYDVHGDKTSWVVHKPDGASVLMFKKTQVYDATGRVTAATYYQSDNSVASKESVSYEDDSHGNWIQRTTLREVFERNGVRVESDIFFRTLTYF